MKASDLAAWIVSMHARGASVFMLRHVVWRGGEALEDVQPFGFEEGFASELAAEILSIAQEDANATGGTQTYGLWAEARKEGELAGVVISRTKWRVHGVALLDPAAGETSPTERPDGAGVTTMTMRHLEARERTLQLATVAVLQEGHRVMKLLAGDNEDLRREAIALRKEASKNARRSLEIFAEREELLSAKQDREIALARAAKDLEQRTEMLDTFKPALHLFMSKMTGQPLAPAESLPALDAFLTSVSEKQFEAIFPVLTNEQKMLLQALYAERAKHQAAKDEAKKQAAERDAAAQNGAPS